MTTYVYRNGRIKHLKEGLTPEQLTDYFARTGAIVCSKPPSITTLERYVSDGIAKAIDGCRVEPDGTCQHGLPSWLLAMGYI